MPDTTTINYGFVQPEEFSSDDTWGEKLNANWASVDGLLAGDTGVGVTPDLVAGWSIAGVAVTATAAQLNAANTRLNALEDLIDSAIITWRKPIAEIPAGWQLCDGTNGTLDLRDRFIVGAGTTYAVGDTGGAASVTLTTAELPSHTHTGTTGSSGAHNHTYTRYETIGNASGSDLPSNRGALTRNTSTAGEHTHSFTTDSTGSGEAHENRPPYYALAYIQRPVV